MAESSRSRAFSMPAAQVTLIEKSKAAIRKIVHHPATSNKVCVWPQNGAFKDATYARGALLPYELQSRCLGRAIRNKLDGIQPATIIVIAA